MKSFAHEVPKGGENLTDHWLTPPELVHAAGPFDLDPCAYHAQPWPTATTMYTLPQTNGLLTPWKGSVFCNPPYGDEVVSWANRLALHDDGVLLVFARTETVAFRPVWKHASGILFFYRRISFRRPDGSIVKGGGGAPSVLAAFGQKNIERLARVRQHKAFAGALVEGWQR